MEYFKNIVGNGEGQKIFFGFAEEILPKLPKDYKFDIVYFDTLRPPPEEKYQRANNLKNIEIALNAAIRLKKGFFILQGEKMDQLVSQLIEIFNFQYLADFTCVYPLRPLRKDYQEVPQISDRVVILGTYGQKLNKPTAYPASDWDVKRLYPKESSGKRYYVERGVFRFYEGEKMPSVTSVLQSENEKLEDVFSNKTKSEVFYYKLFNLVSKNEANRLLIIHFGSGTPILAAEKMSLDWSAIGSFKPAIDGVVEKLRRLDEEKSIFGNKPHGKPARTFSVLALKNAESPESEVLPESA